MTQCLRYSKATINESSLLLKSLLQIVIFLLLFGRISLVNRVSQKSLLFLQGAIVQRGCPLQLGLFTLSFLLLILYQHFLFVYNATGLRRSRSICKTGCKCRVHLAFNLRINFRWPNG